MSGVTGLTPQTLDRLRQIFQLYPEVERVVLYGSRAKGVFHERSDIDLVVFGQQVERRVIAAILLDLDDSDIPLQVDLQCFHDLGNPQLIDHIRRVGVLVYARGTHHPPASGGLQGASV